MLGLFRSILKAMKGAGMKKIVLSIVVFFVFQSMAFAADKLECTHGGRYQFYGGAVDIVFDTQTGKSYWWFPRDDKTGENPHLFVQDPVNGKGMRIQIDFTEKPAAKK